MTRRELLLSLPAVAVARPAFGQARMPVIPVKALNHFTLAVSDIKRSLDFYQGLFGMPIQARQGSTVLLRMGNGPQFLALTRGRSESAEHRYEGRHERREFQRRPDHRRRSRSTESRRPSRRTPG